MHIDLDEIKIEENLSKIYAMAEKSVGLMLYKDIRVSFAESCTGGLLSEIITSVPGASSVFEAGFCTYSERIKMKILSVPESVISETTVVSEETALYMARGMKDISSSDIAVSVTGIAGPSGAMENKPVGTVCVAFCYGGKEETTTLKFYKLGERDRETIRKLTATAVYLHLNEILTDWK